MATTLNVLRRCRKVNRVLWAVVLAALLPGCGDKYDFEPVFPVTGSLFVRGKPAAGAMVTFHPADALNDYRATRSFATVEADGSFALTTYFPGDGVPSGDYVVTLNWPGQLPPTAHPTDVPSDHLGGRYSSPAKPFTRVTVQEEPKVLEPFRVKL